jgi:hypothetical protein
VKIFPQRLPAFPPLNLCALRALCCEFLRPFRIITLRIAFPVTPLFSQPSALPGGVTLSGLRGPNSVLSVLHFFFQLFCCQWIAASCTSLGPLFRPPALCFQSFPASFPKTPGVGWASRMPLRDTRGGGYPLQSGTAISGCPPTISQQFSTSTKWRTDDSKTRSPIQPTFGVPPLASPNL